MTINYVPFTYLSVCVVIQSSSLFFTTSSTQELLCCPKSQLLYIIQIKFLYSGSGARMNRCNDIRFRMLKLLSLLDLLIVLNLQHSFITVIVVVVFSTNVTYRLFYQLLILTSIIKEKCVLYGFYIFRQCDGVTF